MSQYINRRYSVCPGCLNPVRIDENGNGKCNQCNRKVHSPRLLSQVEIEQQNNIAKRKINKKH